MTAVLSAHKGNDTGGTGWRIANAFSGEQDWTFRSACNPDILSYLDYPVDVPWQWSLIQELYLESEVFHARNDWSTYERLAGSHPLPRLIHYHGTNFRVLNAKRLREQAAHHAQGLVSTLDLWLIAPDRLEWLPSPYDLPSLQQIANDVRS